MTTLFKAVGFVFCLVLMTPTSSAVSLKPLDTDFTLQLMGSGGPISDDARASSGTVIWWKGKSRILIDTGGGVYVRFGEAKARLEDLDFIGITHLHTDHVTDLPALLKGGIFFDRARPLFAVGPDGRKPFPAFTDFMHALFNPQTGAYAYLAGIYDGSGRLFPVVIENVDHQKTTPTKVYEHDGLTIRAMGIPHGNIPSLAYRVESDEGVIVISADQNGQDKKFIDFAQGADILVMPVALHEEAGKASRFLHAIPSTIGQIAQQVQPKALILNHWMGKSLQRQKEAISIIKQYYPGPVYSGRDLDAYPMRSVKGKKKR